MGDVILEAQGLQYEYPGGRHASVCCEGYRHMALDGADLVVHRNVRMSLLGGNGAGKTTLLLHMNGMLKPRKGAVLVEGEPADYSRAGIRAWRQKVGLVFQDPDSQLFAASVLQDVSFGPLNLGLSEAEARERVDEALAAMGISGLTESPTHMLSFGQKKRVAIAGVLAMRPEVLVLDEPTAGLDPLGVEQLIATLEQLQASGATIIISTHDVDLAYAWADEAAILAHGRVARQGPPQEAMRDADAMRDSNLRVPWVLAAATALEEKGVAHAGGRMPRTVPELVDLLSSTDGDDPEDQERQIPAS